MASAFKNGSIGAEGLQWAQSCHDRIWRKAEWQLAGDRKRKRTFDGHESDSIFRR